MTIRIHYVLGTASVARALSGNVDSMFAHRMSNYSRQGKYFK